MRATDILPQQTLDEVSMTPTDYAADIESAGPRGVLVGFEFEVCIPQSFRTGRRDDDEITPDKIAKLIKYYSDDLFFDTWNTEDYRKFDSVFRPKPGVAKFNSMMDCMRDDQDGAVTDIKKIWEKKIPEEVRIKLMKVINRSGKTHAELARTVYGQSLVDSMRPEIQFAAAVRAVAYKTRGIKITDWYWEIARLIEQPFSVERQLKRLFGGLVGMVGRRFNNYFDYDPEEAQRYLDSHGYNEENMSNDDYDVDQEYRGGADKLAPLLKQTFGMPVTVFNDYHQSTKQRGRWYIEPDGSLEPDDDDSSAEVVTPPYPAPQAVGVLRDFFTLAKDNGFYTSKENSTGLHINISIPKHVDVLKLAMFTGDMHVLRQFGREFNTYAESVYRSLTAAVDITSNRQSRELQATPDMPDKIDVLDRIAANISRNHTASISDNGKYISFRHVGGDYLKDYSEIEAVLGRFIRAMMIANDPDAHREEYLKKLSKIITTGAKQDPTPLARYRAIINQLRNQGLPAVECRAFIWNARVRDPGANVLRAVIGNVGQSSTNRFMSPDPGDRTKATMLAALEDSGRSGTLGRSAVEHLSKKIQTTNAGFYVGTWAPTDIKQIEAVMAWQPKSGVQSVTDSGRWQSDGYAIGKKTVLPPTSPLTVAAMQYVLKELRQELASIKAPQQPQRAPARGSRRRLRWEP